eukprot:TRINITY_DN70811_c0_g1_i1.p1 TRINITY_DN70811_c0_g1~~TRINITY_DN70811_c0_g1_i1.p1  ORF type:complete len:498 (-),score=92.62 TRINITY_DN70811_c0_g1_i1:427-1920(-)
MPHILEVKRWSKGDIVAGLTVAATSLPQYIAYAELAGLEGHRGLATAGPPLLAFSLVTASPCLCIGVTSIAAIMSNAALQGSDYRDVHGDAAWMDLLGAFSVLVGLASAALAAVGAGNLTKYIPPAVSKGWKLGFAVTVLSAQIAGCTFHEGAGFVKKNCDLPQGLVKGGGGAIAMYRMAWTLTCPHRWHSQAAALSAVTLLVVLKLKSPISKATKLPGLEVLAAGALGAVAALMLGYSGDMVGMPPAGDISPLSNTDFGISSLLRRDDPQLFNMLSSTFVRKLPWEMPWSVLFQRLGGVVPALFSATGFAAVNFLAIIACNDACPPPDGWSPARELAGQGVACMVSGMLGSAPVGGSLSRSMVANLTGAQSPIMGAVCGLASMMLSLPQVAVLLAPTPKAVLAAIVVAAVLPTVAYPKDMLKLSGVDAVVAWTTALATCFADPTRGFGIGMVSHWIFLLLMSLRLVHFQALADALSRASARVSPAVGDADHAGHAG